MSSEHIQNKLALLPDQPGCYLMKDRQGTIIYVGKAKNFKKIVFALIFRERTTVKRNA